MAQTAKSLVPIPTVSSASKSSATTDPTLAIESYFLVCCVKASRSLRGNVRRPSKQQCEWLGVSGRPSPGLITPPGLMTGETHALAYPLATSRKCCSDERHRSGIGTIADILPLVFAGRELPFLLL